MLRYFTTRLPSLMMALVVILAIAPKAVFASGATLTLTTSNLTVIEGNNITLDFTLTNNTGSTLLANTFAFNLLPQSGDPSDTLGSSLFEDGTCNVSVSDGSSCSFSLTFETPNDSGETDADFGLIPTTATVNFEYGCSVQTGCPFNSSATTAQFDVKVEDVGATATTPEPSSLLFAATGLLLGIAFVLSRRSQEGSRSVERA